MITPNPKCISALLFFITLLFCVQVANAQFTTTWNTTDGEITIPTGTGTFSYNITWTNTSHAGVGDGSASGLTGSYTITGLTSGDNYRVEISGLFPHFQIGGNTTEGAKLLSIDSWGGIVWQSMNNSFNGCINLTYNTSEVPNLSNVTDMQYMFANCNVFNGNIDNWNTSTVTNMSFLFYNNFTFNQPLNSWDVSQVGDMQSMFEGASVFNQNLDNWDVGSVYNMGSLFRTTSAFNGNIGTWNTSGVTEMANMFQGASAFNQSLSAWNVGAVTSMMQMFGSATSFNGTISNWNVGNVTNMQLMFANASVFNQDLSLWNVSSVTNMGGMFASASLFNGNIGTWNVNNVTNMGGMFSFALAFNQGLNGWNVSNVTDTRSMFQFTPVFNGNISSWNMANVVEMGAMFYNATAFNSDISAWNVSKVTNMNAVFLDASSFNQNLAGWNVSHATSMLNLFARSALTDANYNNILIGWAALPSLQHNVQLDAPDNQYCSGAAARAAMIGTYGWTVNDAGSSCIPTITSFTPTSAGTEATVTITGTNFTDATAITFGGTNATSFTVVSATSITAVVGAGTTGVIVVDTPNGTATSAIDFTFIVTPTITSFTPTSAASGATVTITGTNFTGATAVRFGGTDATSYVVVSATSITAVVAAGSASGSVSVVTPIGTATRAGFINSSNPPVITTAQLSTSVEGRVTLNLVPLIATTNSTLDLTSLKILVQPSSGALATIDANGMLIIEYAGRLFSGTEQITIEACDTNGNCSSQVFTIEVTGNIIVYNGLSPGGMNPDLIIEYIDILEDTKNNTVIIFDRWQNQVWKGENYNNTSVVFSGVSDSGKELPSGVYFYRIDFTGGRKRQSGFISLKR